LIHLEPFSTSQLLNFTSFSHLAASAHRGMHKKPSREKRERKNKIARSSMKSNLTLINDNVNASMRLFFSLLSHLALLSNSLIDLKTSLMRTRRKKGQSEVRECNADVCNLMQKKCVKEKSLVIDFEMFCGVEEEIGLTRIAKWLSDREKLEFFRREINSEICEKKVKKKLIELWKNLK
jgi:hypothetical protein